MVAVLSAAACQTDSGAPPSLSLEQAKKVTVTFDRQALVAPPRTISDITAILNSNKKPDGAAFSEHSTQADAKAPVGASLRDTIRFLEVRGWSAFKIGRTAQAIADLGSANTLAQNALRMPPDRRARLLERLAVARYSGGNPLDAIEELKQAIELSTKPGKSAALRARLAIWLTHSCDLDGAEAVIKEAEDKLSEANSRNGINRSNWQWNEPFVKATIKRAAALVRSSRGDYTGAEQTLRAALADMAVENSDTQDEDVRRHMRMADFARGDLGMALLRQGRPLEAEVDIRAALDSTLKREGRYSPLSAKFLSQLAAVMTAEGRPADAEKLARAAIEILQTIGSEDGSRFTELARVMLGKSLAAQGKWPEANAIFAVLLGPNSPDYALALRGIGPIYGVGLLMAGDHSGAAGQARKALAILEPRLGRDNRATAEMVAVLAASQAAAGDRQGAMANFAHSIPILLNRSQTINDENGTNAGNSYWLDYLLEAYIRLLSEVDTHADAATPGRNAADIAFSIADAARGQRVQRALAAAAARAKVGDADLADLVRREQDTVRRIGALNALYANAVSVPEGQRNADALNSMRHRIEQLRGARAALVGEIERRSPNFSELVTPKPATAEGMRQALHPDEALIATYVGQRDTYVWAISRDHPTRFARVPLPAARLAAAVRDLRAAMAPRGSTVAGIPAYDVTLAYQLYKTLLAPVRDGWQDAKSLIIIAHGPLGQLPFQLLVTEPGGLPPASETAGLFSGYRTVPWLIRTHAVTVLPSAGSLATLRLEPAAVADRQPFVGFGDPVFDPSAPASTSGQTTVAMRGGSGSQIALRAAPTFRAGASASLKDLPRLPDTATEIRSIAAALHADPARDIFIGPAASEAEVHAAHLERYKVVAFATHGLVPGELDGLTQPALALSAPPPNQDGYDGLLTMGKILGLKLNADWVVLSACNTAAGDGKGVEAISGLGRAFFYAGTRAILASNWPVESASARMLTTDLFKRQAQSAALGRAEALRQAMVAMIDQGAAMDPSGKVAFTYAHPIFWAPFSLFGDGGMARPGS